TGRTYDRQGLLATWHSLVRAQDATERVEPLATLGDWLALCREWVSGSGVAGRKFDVGPYEIEYVILSEVDTQGRRAGTEIFATDHLGDAVARLYERYAELLPDGPARARAAATARSVAAMEGPLDLDRSAASLDSSIESIDHRTLGTWSSRGAEAFLQNLRAWPEVAESVTLRIDDVLAVRPDTFLGRWTNFGTARVGGGTFERPYLKLVRFGADGRLTRNEVFDVDRDAEALARFDELAAEPAAVRFAAAPSQAAERVVRHVRTNAATANTARIDAAIAEHDLDALASLVADALDVTDHPTGTTIDRHA